MQRFSAFVNDDGVSILYFTTEMIKEVFRRLISNDISSSYLVKGIVKGVRVLFVK